MIVHRGFGPIVSKRPHIPGADKRDDSPDVFVHHSAIRMEGFRTLREGEEVQFELLESPKGLQAVNVSRPQ